MFLNAANRPQIGFGTICSHTQVMNLSPNKCQRFHEKQITRSVATSNDETSLGYVKYHKA